MIIDPFDIVIACDIFTLLGRLTACAIGSVLTGRVSRIFDRVGQRWEIVMEV